MRKLFRNQDGLSRPIIILVIVVLLVIIGAAISQSNKKDNKTNTQSNTSTTTAVVPISSACSKNYNDDNLCRFANYTDLANHQYIATGSAIASSGAKTSFIIENDGKGNSKLVFGVNGKQLSQITLNGYVYIQTGVNTTWQEYPASSAGAAAIKNPANGFSLNFNTSTPADVSVEKMGITSCGTKTKSTCYKYKVVETSAPGTLQYILFDTHTYLLRQWSAINSTTKEQIEINFSYIGIPITKPSPVKQATN